MMATGAQAEVVELGTFAPGQFLPCVRFQSDNILDLRLDPVRLGTRQVDLVDDRQMRNFRAKNRCRATKR